jgi:hypothetical protein
MYSVSSTLINRINHLKKDAVFTTKSFLDLGSRSNVDIILFRLCQKGKIKRLKKGIYYKSIKHKILGNIPPSVNDILQAISIQNNEKLYPSGATCANALSLSTQVPGKYWFYTTGKSRIENLGGCKIRFIHFTRIKFPNDIASIVVYILIALYYIGKKYIKDKDIQRCKSFLKTKKDKKDMKNMITNVPSWMIKYIKKLLD